MDEQPRNPVRRRVRAIGEETARATRKRKRAGASEERERQALELFLNGETYEEIGAALKVSRAAAWTIVKRGLARRAETEGPMVEAARQRYLGIIDVMMSTWMPRAVGKGLDADLQPMPPNEGAAKIVLSLLDRYADVHGIRAPQQVEIDLGRPANAEEIVTGILEHLARERAKSGVIDGHLAQAGTDLAQLTGGDVPSDTLPPPAILQKAASAA